MRRMIMNLKIENWKLLLLSIFYIIFAVLSYVIPQEDYLSFFRIAGIILALIGLFQILIYFFKKEYMKPNEFSFAFGVLYMLAGFIVMFRPEIIVNNYPFVFSGVMVLDSTLRLQYSMNLFRLKVSQWKANMILAIVPMVLGMILILVDMEKNFLLNYFSFLLMLDAIANVYTVLYYKGIVKRYEANARHALNHDEIMDIDAE